MIPFGENEGEKVKCLILADNTRIPGLNQPPKLKTKLCEMAEVLQKPARFAKAHM
jgi:hypothetical protein